MIVIGVIQIFDSKSTTRLTKITHLFPVFIRTDIALKVPFVPSHGQLGARNLGEKSRLAFFRDTTVTAHLFDDCGCVLPPRTDQTLKDPISVPVLSLLLKRDVLVDAAADGTAEKDL